MRKIDHSYVKHLEVEVERLEAALYETRNQLRKFSHLHVDMREAAENIRLGIRTCDEDYLHKALERINPWRLDELKWRGFHPDAY